MNLTAGNGLKKPGEQQVRLEQTEGEAEAGDDILFFLRADWHTHADPTIDTMLEDDIVLTQHLFCIHACLFPFILYARRITPSLPHLCCPFNVLHTSLCQELHILVLHKVPNR